MLAFLSTLGRVSRSFKSNDKIVIDDDFEVEDEVNERYNYASNTDPRELLEGSAEAMADSDRFNSVYNNLANPSLSGELLKKMTICSRRPLRPVSNVGKYKDQSAVTEKEGIQDESSVDEHPHHTSSEDPSTAMSKSNTSKADHLAPTNNNVQTEVQSNEFHTQHNLEAEIISSQEEEQETVIDLTPDNQQFLVETNGQSGEVAQDLNGQLQQNNFIVTFGSNDLVDEQNNDRISFVRPYAKYQSSQKRNPPTMPEVMKSYIELPRIVKQHKGRNSKRALYTKGLSDVEDCSKSPYKNRKLKRPELASPTASNTKDITSKPRRSNRGHMPLKNNWSFRTSDPTSLFEVLYKKQIDLSLRRKKKRLEKLSINESTSTSKVPKKISGKEKDSQKRDLSCCRPLRVRMKRCKMPVQPFTVEALNCSGNAEEESPKGRPLREPLNNKCEAHTVKTVANPPSEAKSPKIKSLRVRVKRHKLALPSTSAEPVYSSNISAEMECSQISATIPPPPSTRVTENNHGHNYITSKPFTQMQFVQKMKCLEWGGVNYAFYNTNAKIGYMFIPHGKWKVAEFLRKADVHFILMDGRLIFVEKENKKSCRPGELIVLGKNSNYSLENNTNNMCILLFIIK